MAELARVDEENLVTSVTQLFVAGNAVGAVTGEKPEAYGDLRRIEELAG